MNVYLFDVESGLYQGEQFCEPSALNGEDDSTCQAPPLNQPGQAPVYGRPLANGKPDSGDRLRKAVKNND